jgi:hypothetical protein
VELRPALAHAHALTRTADITMTAAVVSDLPSPERSEVNDVLAAINRHKGLRSCPTCEGTESLSSPRRVTRSRSYSEATQRGPCTRPRDRLASARGVSGSTSTHASRRESRSTPG